MVAAAMVVALLTITCGGFCLGSAVIGRHRAQAAADLAAVAAAARLPSGTEAACKQAARVVRRMGADCVDCHVDRLDVVVIVQIPVAFSGWGGAGAARAAARAGPT